MHPNFSSKRQYRCVIWQCVGAPVSSPLCQPWKVSTYLPVSPPRHPSVLCSPAPWREIRPGFLCIAIYQRGRPYVLLASFLDFFGELPVHGHCSFSFGLIVFPLLIYKTSIYILSILMHFACILILGILRFLCDHYQSFHAINILCFLYLKAINVSPYVFFQYFETKHVYAWLFDPPAAYFRFW